MLLVVSNIARVEQINLIANLAAKCLNKSTLRFNTVYHQQQHIPQIRNS